MNGPRYSIGGLLFPLVLVLASCVCGNNTSRTAPTRFAWMVDGGRDGAVEPPVVARTPEVDIELQHGTGSAPNFRVEPSSRPTSPTHGP